MTPYPDEPLFQGIERFQKDQGLTVDGIMKPSGETESKVNEVWKQQYGEGRLNSSLLNKPELRQSSPSPKAEKSLFAPFTPKKVTLSNNGFSQDYNLRRKNLLSDSTKTMNIMEKAQEIKGVLKDMYRNYTNMKNDGTINGDDYFHCKAQYEAADRGPYGEKTAKYVGNVKENFDYLKNRIVGNLSPSNAYADYLHDKYVNMQGRHQSKIGLYKSSKDGCNYKRVRGINDKY